MKTEMHNCPGFTKLNNTGRLMISLGGLLKPEQKKFCAKYIC